MDQHPDHDVLSVEFANADLGQFTLRTSAVIGAGRYNCSQLGRIHDTVNDPELLRNIIHSKQE
jgi:hypothetical protein